MKKNKRVAWNKGLSGEEYLKHYPKGVKGFMKGNESKFKGKKHTKETKNKMRRNHPDVSGENNPMFGKNHLNETKKKISLGKKNPSNETRNLMSKARKGKTYEEIYGKERAIELKEKKRILAFEYAKKIGELIFPRIGHNEKQLLDKLEQELKHKILRQFKVCGYFVDGYIPELKLVIEVDEIPKIKEKDIERQKIIEDKLNCRFIRIKDFD